MIKRWKAHYTEVLSHLNNEDVPHFLITVLLLIYLTIYFTSLSLSFFKNKKGEKRMIYLSNAFSLQMLNIERVNYIEITPLNLEEVKKLLSKGFISIIGHRDTANVLSSTLNIIIPYNRISIRLNIEDTLIVAQFVGGRLPEGTNTLPEGYKIEFFKVNIVW